MRVLPWLAAGLLCAAGGVVGAVSATPASAAPGFGASLTLDPSSGKAGTVVLATFQANAPDGTKCRLRVTYRWDGQVIGQDRTDGCVSTIKFRAPRAGRENRPHQISAVDSTNHLAAGAIFTLVTGDATPSPDNTQATPGATGTQVPDAVPPPADNASPEPSVAAVKPNAAPRVQASSSLSSIALIFGGALVLGGVVILILVVLRMRRGGADHHADRDWVRTPSYAGSPATPTIVLPPTVEQTQRIEYPPAHGIPD